MMKLKKILAGICSIVLLASGSIIQLSASAAPEYPEDVFGYLGDLNRDWEVSLADIIIMQKYLLGIQTITQNQTYFADMNQDSIINVYDLIQMKKSLLSEKWTEFGKFPPPPEETTEETTEEPETDTFITPPVAQIQANLPSQGNAGLVIFYVDFPDCQYDYAPSEAEINEIAFGAEDTADSNYPFDSMSAFYRRSSKGAMQLSGQAFRYTAKENRAAYDTDKNKLLHECYEAFDQQIDFSQFDGNGDGKIDATLLTVPAKSGDTDWWPCAGPSGSEKIVDGIKIGHLITGNAQIVSLTDYENFNSSYLHELGHCMGLPDYYLYHSDDGEGFHGDQDAGGLELMDMDASTDFSCFSKLMLGWYKQSQVAVYDQNQGGEQIFTLSNAQTDIGNCLILPYGKEDRNGEYLILEYITPDGNNSDPVYEWLSSGNGIRAYHVKADIYDNGWWKSFKYENGGEHTSGDDEGIRLIRLVNDIEGGAVFRTGDVLDGSLSGWHWYASDESESVETGYSVTVGECKDGQYTVTVNKT